MRKIIISMLLLTLLFGCSLKANSRPDSVREEIWYNGLEIYKISKEFMKDKQELDINSELKIKNFTDRHGLTLQPEKDGFTEIEGDIVSAVYLFYLNYLGYQIAILTGNDEDLKKSLSGCEKNLKVLNEIYGL